MVARRCDSVCESLAEDWSGRRGLRQIIRDFSLQASNYVQTRLCSLMINSPLGTEVIKTSFQKSLD